MAALSAEQIDQLLGQAEKRLEARTAAQSSKPFVPAPAASQEVTSGPESQRLQKVEKVSLRDPRPGQQTKRDDAGPDWYGMPKTNLTKEFKRDWEVLRMRGMLDPAHHKKTLHSKVPKYAQVGEIIAGATDSYGSRLTRKEKKQTLLEEIMSTQDRDKLQTKYAGIMKKKNDGKKAFYAKRGGKRKGYK